VVICLERGADFFAYGPADATPSQNPLSLASFKSRQVLPFWYQLTQFVLERMLLNGCISSSSVLIIKTIFMINWN